MPSFDENYLSYYQPLVREFLSDLADAEHPDVKLMPQPHLPLFGPAYERSAVRLAVVGQDTKWWHDLRDFIAGEQAQPCSRLRAALDHFRTGEFRTWGDRRNTFAGFTMMMLASLHGHENWQLMKWGGLQEILHSFAWAETNAIELYSSTVAGRGVPWEYWERVRAAGERFNRIRHLIATLKPHGVLILCRSFDVNRYFEGCRWERVSGEGRLTHYLLPDHGVDVFHAPHPRSMNFIEGTDAVCARLRELFVDHGVAKPFPEFLQEDQVGTDILDFLLKRSPAPTPKFDKYAFVAWVAEELKKRETYMSVPALMTLVNRKGYRTNYGTEFEGGRGSYRLVSSAYHRLAQTAGPDKAWTVAVAFRRPNFEYAFKMD